MSCRRRRFTRILSAASTSLIRTMPCCKAEREIRIACPSVGAQAPAWMTHSATSAVAGVTGRLAVTWAVWTRSQLRTAVRALVRPLATQISTCVTQLIDRGGCHPCSMSPASPQRRAWGPNCSHAAIRCCALFADAPKSSTLGRTRRQFPSTLAARAKARRLTPTSSACQVPISCLCWASSIRAAGVRMGPIPTSSSLRVHPCACPLKLWMAACRRSVPTIGMKCLHADEASPEREASGGILRTRSESMREIGSCRCPPLPRSPRTGW